MNTKYTQCKRLIITIIFIERQREENPLLNGFNLLQDTDILVTCPTEYAHKN